MVHRGPSPTGSVQVVFSDVSSSVDRSDTFVTTHTQFLPHRAQVVGCCAVHVVDGTTSGPASRQMLEFSSFYPRGLPCPLSLDIPRSKTPFNLTLSGITNDDVDLSVDALKAVTLPLLKHFGVAEEGGLELKVLFVPVYRASS